MTAARRAEHPIHPLFIDRWSPRSFTGEPLPESVLLSAFEAARWAPSASNAQPWRFVVARNGDRDWNDFLALLMPRNRRWAQRASALVLITSALHVDRGGERVSNVSHSFDAGAAWANLSHQLLLLGWHTHGIGGFDRATARTELGVPDDHAIEAMIAIGRRSGLDELHEDFHAQESPNGRRPLSETVFAGRFGLTAFPERRNAA